ncbi:NO signaling/Golgi transport ligand-binding domain protein [Raphanus sativus]|nr:NO signaling/Golgi transport ligand-binding domain protein [Raphanus sativus]
MSVEAAAFDAYFKAVLQCLEIADSASYFMIVQGTFVLQDNKFRWLSRVSIDPSSEMVTKDPSTPGESKAAQAVSMYLYFPCGIIRGVLSNLGIPCAVSADISSLPTCEFSRLIFVSLFIQSHNHKTGER